MKRFILVALVMFTLAVTCKAMEPTFMMYPPRSQNQTIAMYAVSALIIAGGIYTMNASMARQDMVLCGIGVGVAVVGISISVALYEWGGPE